MANQENLTPSQHASRRLLNTEKAFEKGLKCISNAEIVTNFEVSEIVSPADLVRHELIAFTQLTPSEQSQELDHRFDATGKNAQIVEIAEQTKHSIGEQAELRSQQQVKVKNHFLEEHWNPINSVLTPEKVAKSPASKLINTVFMGFVVMVASVCEVAYPASVINGGAIEPYIGTSGFFKALPIAFSSLLVTIGIKAFIAIIPGSKTSQVMSTLKNLLIPISIIWTVLIVVAFMPIFVKYEDIESIAISHELLLAVFKILEFVMVPIAINMILHESKISSEKYYKKEVFFEQHSAGLDEECESLVYRSEHWNQRFGKVNGFLKHYEAMKSDYVRRNIMNVANMSCEMTYIALMSGESRKPELRVVN
jgi:hypothetical protein